MEKLNFVDFFCGAGGLSHGLIISGFNCILGVDNDAASLKTFEKNHPKAKAFCGNIQDVDEKKLMELIGENEITLASFGVPCQAFSTIGKNDPEDKRRNLFHESMRIVNILKPKVVLMENVTGITSQKNRSVLEAVFKEFTDNGYNVDARILLAQDFGVPQSRRRTFIMGVRRDVGNPIFPIPQYGSERNPYVTVGQAFSMLQGGLKNSDLKSTKIKNFRDDEILSRVPMGGSIRYKRDMERYIPKELWKNLKVDWDKLPEGRLRQERFKRLNLNKLSPTILTSKTTYYHPKENRYLTVQEAACLQSFPSYFEFMGSVSAQWKQIGNAVPPRLASCVGMAIRKIFENSDVAKFESDIDKTFGNFGRAFYYERRKKRLNSL